MGFDRAVKHGAIGFAADLFTGGVTNGLGLPLGVLHGLFEPDAGGMSRAFAGGPFDRTGGGPFARRSGGSMGLLEGLIGHTQGGPNDPEPTTKNWSGLAKAAAILFGATNILPGIAGFSAPLFAYFAGITPYNRGGIIPSLWSNGLIPSWGWSAGILT